MSENETPASGLLVLESFGPIACGMMFFAVDSLWLRIGILDSDWGGRLIDRVIQASVTGVAFWGVAITLLLGMDSKRIVVRLKRANYFILMVRYFSESLFACLLTVILSVILEPLLKHADLTGIWLATCLWALLAVARTFVILSSLLIRSASE